MDGLPQATIKYIDLTDGRLRYREWGSGEPIVFIHGLLVNGTLWQRLAPLLATGFRCIAPDLPLGAHRSPMHPGADLKPPALARLIADFLAALALEDVTLVGNDTGGALSQLVITAHPERIARLVLTNCDAFEEFLPRPLRPLQRAGSLPGSAWLYAQLLRVHVWRSVTVLLRWLCKYPVERELLDGWFAPLRASRGTRRDFQKVLRGIDARYTLDAGARFGAVRQPVLLAWAPEDRFFKLAFAQRLAAALPNARLDLVYDSFTFSPLDQPRHLARLIEEFIFQTAPAAAR